MAHEVVGDPLPKVLVLCAQYLASYLPKNIPSNASLATVDMSVFITSTTDVGGNYQSSKCLKSNSQSTRQLGQITEMDIISDEFDVNWDTPEKCSKETIPGSLVTAWRKLKPGSCSDGKCMKSNLCMSMHYKQENLNVSFTICFMFIDRLHQVGEIHPAKKKNSSLV